MASYATINVEGVCGIVQQTKTALSESLIALLSQKTLDKITVSDITSRCGVNRQTFYYYFKDIYDLINWTYENLADKALSGKKTYATWKQNYCILLKIILDNKEFVLNTYSSITREEFEKAIGRKLFSLTRTVTEELSSKMQVSDENKNFISRFYSYAFLGMTLEWMLAGMTEPPAEFTERIDKVVKGDITSALERMRTDGPKYRYY